MGVLIVILGIVEVLVCLLLVGVILLQRSKGAGAGVSFGGGAAEAVFGAQMGDVLTKTTVILGIVFLANTLALSLLQRGAQRDSWLEQEAKAQQQRAAAALPAATQPFAAEAESAAADALDAAAALDGVVRADEAATATAAAATDSVATAAASETPPAAADAE